MKQLFKIQWAGHKMVVACMFLALAGYAQESTKDSISSKQLSLDEVLVSAIRVTTQTPVSFSNLTKEEFASRNLGQDIPIMMNYLPSVVTTTDAGAGVGYTGIRVRGSDATRVNVTLNGIPYNDSESQGTFWVNLVDMASSTQSIQLQRGVGTSTNGAGAFGASLNLLTDAYAKESTSEVSNSYGSFNTKKHTVKFSTGLLNDSFEVAGRLSKISSDGYIDRAFSDLKGYFLQGTYVGKSTLLKALVFGGNEKTYQAWNGTDAETMASDRRYNSAGAYLDSQGNLRFYDNEVDDYQQDHYQFHWNEKWNQNWSSTVALHYTIGKGFYENYKSNAKFSSYGLTPFVQNGSIINRTDLVRQKWLDNDFYGTTFSVRYQKNKIDFIAGGAINRYEGAHFGKVIWARYASQSQLGDRYYDDSATKNDANIFAKINYKLHDKWSLFGDLQYRNVQYKADGVQPTMVNDTFRFINPKAGVTYMVNDSQNIYLSYARANREPNRNDYEAANFKAEKLNDLEIGWRYVTAATKFNANVYYMAYKDQLILTGELDDVGNPIRSTSENSYRLGVELDGSFTLSDKWQVRPNLTLSANKNIDLTVDNQFIGTKDISYSPSIVAANMLSYQPIENLQVGLLSKFVGKQYMNNVESESAKLPSYFVSDLNISYEMKPKRIAKSIVFSTLINNVFDKEYVSNGYMWDVYPYYYPQAGINILTGITVQF